MNTNTATRPTLHMKGSLVATQVIGNIVELWFSSPTGDSSDSHIFQMKCQSHSQAVTIANNHNAMWNVPFTHEIQTFDESKLEDSLVIDLI
jgi:glutamate synthase domain-containing protein 1